MAKGKKRQGKRGRKSRRRQKTRKILKYIAPVVAAAALIPAASAGANAAAKHIDNSKRDQITKDIRSLNRLAHSRTAPLHRRKPVVRGKTYETWTTSLYDNGDTWVNKKYPVKYVTGPRGIFHDHVDSWYEELSQGWLNQGGSS